MSRLDSFIRRMQAQRACLDWAARMIADLPGPVLELGLGNGRTYDHLREVLPGRDIYVFDRRMKAHPSSVPPDDRLFLGEVGDTLPAADARFGPTVALVHTDLGVGVAEEDDPIAAIISPWLGRLLRPGGVVVANQPLAVARFVPLPEPDGVRPGRYFLYRGDALET